MSRAKRRPPRGMGVLPEGAEPCVWMAAGMVAYKLCDRGFDCENCPLDAALRGDAADRVDHAPPGPREVETFEFPGDRRFHPCHTWAMAVGDHAVRCGVDMFAARLLPRVRSIVLPARGTRVHGGRVGVWVVDDGELIPLRSPVSGEVMRRNPALQSEPGLLAISPYDDGWLLEIDCLEHPEQLDDLLDSRQVRVRAEREKLALHGQVAGYAGKGRDRVGATLADGGTRLTDIRKIVGPERYRRLIARILG